MSRRRGFTVAEALVALLLGFLLAVLALATFARQRSVQGRLARRAETLAALRVSRDVLGEEIGWGDGTETVGPDTIALRAFRGIGVVCAVTEGGEGLVVRVRGARAPDPAKDSVLIVATDGETRVVALVARGAPSVPCPTGPDDPLEEWGLSGAAPAGPLLARYFERGSYHLTGSALRYRRGGGGRQPLTPEVLRTPPSGFVPGGGGVTIRLYADGDGPAEPPHVFSFHGSSPDG